MSESELIEEVLEKVLQRFKTEITLVDRYGREIISLGMPLGVSLRRNAVIRAPNGNLYKVLSSPFIDYMDRTSVTYPSVKVIAKSIYATDGEERWLNLSTSAGTE